MKGGGDTSSAADLPSPLVSSILLLVALLAIFQSYLIQRPPPLLGDSARLPALPTGVTAAPARLGTSLALLGYRLDGQPVQGHTVTLTLYWTAREPSFFNYTIFVHLEDAHGHRIAQHDSQPVSGAQPTTAWQPGAIIVDSHPLIIPSPATPGSYTVHLGAYLLETLQHLPVAPLARQSQAVAIDAGNQELQLTRSLVVMKRPIRP